MTIMTTITRICHWVRRSITCGCKLVSTILVFKMISTIWLCIWKHINLNSSFITIHNFHISWCKEQREKRSHDHSKHNLFQNLMNSFPQFSTIHIPSIWFRRIYQEYDISYYLWVQKYIYRGLPNSAWIYSPYCVPGISSTKYIVCCSCT